MDVLPNSMRSNVWLVLMITILIFGVSTSIIVRDNVRLHKENRTLQNKKDELQVQTWILQTAADKCPPATGSGAHIVKD